MGKKGVLFTLTALAIGLACAYSSNVFSTPTQHVTTSQKTLQRQVTKKLGKELEAKISKPRRPTRTLVDRVIDGDTLEIAVNKKKRSVRLVCIDARESGEDFYQEAKDTLKGLVAGKTVYMQRDKRNTDWPYRRLLRYVSVTIDEDMAQEYPYAGDVGEIADVGGILVRRGLARVAPFTPDIARCDTYKEYEQLARAEGLNIWNTKIARRPIKYECQRNIYNCSNFTSRTELMKAFRACETDVHRLDPDHDGVPCESLL